MYGVDRLSFRGQSVSTSTARGSRPEQPKGLTERIPLCMMRNTYYMFLLCGSTCSAALTQALKCTTAERPAGPVRTGAPVDQGLPRLPGSDCSLTTEWGSRRLSSAKQAAMRIFRVMHSATHNTAALRRYGRLPPLPVLSASCGPYGRG